MADRPDRGSTTITPRWVKVFGIIFIVVVLMLIVLKFAGGGSHGPRRHTPSGNPVGHTPPTEHGGQWS